MKNKSQNHLPIFGKDIEDDWSFDKLEEEMRESRDDYSDADDQDYLKIED